MFEVKLPRISEDHDESSVVLWFKQEGDQVSKGDTLAEVQTEKAVSEIEAEKSGILEKILIKRGEIVNVDDILCIINKAYEHSTEETKINDKTSSTKSKNEDSPQKFRVAPRLRKIAKNLEVDLSTVKGTGREGKITEEDIRNTAVNGDLAESIDQNLTGTRKTIAKRMKESLTNSAQLTETAYADITKLSEKRNTHESKLSWNVWIIYAAMKALKKHPCMNGTFENGILKQGEAIHLGIATDTGEGLLVPVVKNASQYLLNELQEKIANKAELARSKKLPIEEMSGSTFTITNLGAYGVHFFTPIINPPEIAILGLGKIENYLFKEDGKIKDGQRLPISLTFDHQVVDGAPAAKFLKTFIEILENPEDL